MPAINPGRLAAARALLSCEGGAHIEDALAECAPHEPSDRALAWNIALGVLRRRDALDAAISVGAQRSLRTIDAAVRAILRVAVFERAFTRTPPHAAVDQAVSLTRVLRVGHAAGFVNGVLRNAPDPDPNLPGYPDVLLSRWRARWPAADAYMRGCNQPAPLTLVPREDEAGLLRLFQHQGFVASPLPGPSPRALLAPPGPVAGLPGFAEGSFWVMDRAALVVADLIAAHAPTGATVLDACAAPGGKTLRLSSLGYALTATDASEARLGRLHENLARTGLRASVRVADWLTDPDDAQYDAVLLDAPCSGLGTTRRHPDIRWRKTQEKLLVAHLQKLGNQQRALLHRLKGRVRPGGVLVYAVCSAEPEETDAVAASLDWQVLNRIVAEADEQGHDLHSAWCWRAPG